MSRLGRLLVRPELACGCPVLFLDIGHDDVHSGRAAFEGVHGCFGDGFRQFPFLFDGASFEELDVDGWHILTPVVLRVGKTLS